MVLNIAACIADVVTKSVYVLPGIGCTEYPNNFYYMCSHVQSTEAQIIQYISLLVSGAFKGHVVKATCSLYVASPIFCDLYWFYCC